MLSDSFYAERHPAITAKLFVVVVAIFDGHTATNKQEADNVKQIKQGLANDPRYKSVFQPCKPEGEAGVVMMQVMQHSLPLYFNHPEKNTRCLWTQHGRHHTIRVCPKSECHGKPRAAKRIDYKSRRDQVIDVVTAFLKG